MLQRFICSPLLTQPMHQMYQALIITAPGVSYQHHGSLPAVHLQHCQPSSLARQAPSPHAVHPATARPCLCSARAQVCSPDGDSRLYSLLRDKGVLLSSDAFQQAWQDTPAWRERMCTDSELQALEAGLVALLNLLGSGAVVARLLTAQPGLLTAPLQSWLTFFEEYGFTNSQTKNLVAQCPEVLVRGSIVDAGLAILHLRKLGFDNEAVRHKVVAFCPQVLMMSPAAIDNMVKMWAKFNAGVTERTC